MRRIEPPKCTCCKSAQAGFDSTVWPGVRLCYPCVRDSITYIIRTGIIDGNPLLIELATGVFPTRKGIDGKQFIDAYYQVGFNVSRNIYIQLEAAQESRSEVENPLDLLG
jgi:hypothetical protein